MVASWPALSAAVHVRILDAHDSGIIGMDYARCITKGA